MTGNEQQRRYWNSPEQVARWKEVESSMAPLLDPLLATAALQEGERVVDIGCGGGLTTLAAADVVGTKGYALGFDLSEPLVELAKERASAAGRSNAAFAAGDAQADSFPGGPFDVAMSRMGVMFFNDPVAAFTNIRRQLKPGGRLVFGCWQPLSRNPWFQQSVLQRYTPPPPPGPRGTLPPGPAAFGSTPYVRRILTRAGFDNVQRRTFSYESVDHERLVYDEAAVQRLQLTPALQQQALAELKQLAERFRRGDGMLHTRRHAQFFTARNPG